MDLKGKVAIVTGGTTGIGACIVLELAKHGANIVIDYVVNEEAAEELEKQVLTLNDQVLVKFLKICVMYNVKYLQGFFGINSVIISM